MKEIKLTQGKAALVDDEDFQRVNQFKWYAHRDRGECWYAVHGNPGTTLHRFLMNLSEGDSRRVDHRNGNGLDNRRICV